MTVKSKIPIIYKGMLLGEPLRLDLLVEDQLLIELKSVRDIHPVHRAQLLSYMKLANRCKGILINFNVENRARTAVHMVTRQSGELPE